jgi:hypothetical protein
VSLVVAVHVDAGEPGADVGGVLADEAGVLQALAAERQQAVCRAELGDLVAAGAVRLERGNAGVEGEDAGRRLCRLRIAVDAAPRFP